MLELQEELEKLRHHKYWQNIIVFHILKYYLTFMKGLCSISFVIFSPSLLVRKSLKACWSILIPGPETRMVVVDLVKHQKMFGIKNMNKERILFSKKPTHGTFLLIKAKISRDEKS